MAKLQNVDLNLDSVSRVTNSLDPLNPQDLATKKYTDDKSLRFKTTIAQSSTSVTYANLTELTTGVLQPGVYAFSAFIKIRSAAAANGYGLRLSNGTATVSDVIAEWALPANADFSTIQNIFYSQRLITDNNVAGTIGLALTDYLATGFGTFTVTLAGTVAIQLRSEANLMAVTAGTASCLVVEQI